VTDTPAFIIGCSNLIGDDDGGFLLVQESKPSAWSRYNLPAGKPETGETLMEAAVREAKEETGFDVVVSHLIGIYQCPQTTEGFGVVNFVFYSEVTGGSLTPSTAHPIVRYFSTADIQELAEQQLVRGRHILLAIADHSRGQSLPLDMIQIVPEMERP
jgi:8-oxo-dGTP pyrophosphatase MutT (NUDIX family)